MDLASSASLPSAAQPFGCWRRRPLSVSNCAGCSLSSGDCTETVHRDIGRAGHRREFPLGLASVNAHGSRRVAIVVASVSRKGVGS